MAQKVITKKNVDSNSHDNLVDDGVLYLGKRKNAELTGMLDGDESFQPGTVFDWAHFRERSGISNIDLRIPVINTIRFWRLSGGNNWGFAIGDYSELKDQWITKIRFYSKNSTILPTLDCQDYVLEGFSKEDHQKIYKFIKSYVI